MTKCFTQLKSHKSVKSVKYILITINKHLCYGNSVYFDRPKGMDYRIDTKGKTFINRKGRRERRGKVLFSYLGKVVMDKTLFVVGMKGNLIILLFIS